MLIADTNECFALALVKMPCASDPSFLFRGAEEPVSNILSSQKGILKPVEDALIIAAAELNSRRPPTADRRPPTADRRPPTADRRLPAAHEEASHSMHHARFYYVWTLTRTLLT